MTALALDTPSVLIEIDYSSLPYMDRHVQPEVSGFKP